jgi:hypothetical protein
MPKTQKKVKRRLKSNLQKNLISQTVAGSAACVTTTTSREEPNVSDARRSEIQAIVKVNQNTSDKWKTKRKRLRSPDKMAKINQDRSSIKPSIVRCHKSTV